VFSVLDDYLLILNKNTTENEFYNLANDLGETNNVITHYPQVFSEMRNTLLNWAINKEAQLSKLSESGEPVMWHE